MKKIIVDLADKERAFLKEKRREVLTARVRNRIDILLLSDQGKTNEEIIDHLAVFPQMIWSTKLKYRDHGLAAALSEKRRSGRPVKYGIDSETELTALACTDPPLGRDHWTAELLMEKMRETVKGCRGISDEQVRLMLKKTIVNLGKSKSGVLARLMKNTGIGCTA